MSTFILRDDIACATKIVIKVGSRILTADNNRKKKNIEILVDDIVSLRKNGHQAVLVSSGAIAGGMKTLGLAKRPATIPMQQVCASIGQIKLMQSYDSLFSMHNITIGQVLLTWDDLRNKERYLNLRNTLNNLLEYNAVPIINENDSVGTDEIKFGDNDTLGAQISLLTQADLYVNMTDVGGLFDSNPNTSKNARHIPVVHTIDATLRSFAGTNVSAVSVGGMITKIKAADMVTRAGITALVGDGFSKSLMQILTDKSAGTVFLPAKRRMPSRLRWMAFAGKASGTIMVDAGAKNALITRGTSLLPAGIKAISGQFHMGDMVDIIDITHKVIARGLTQFSAEDARNIAGCKTSEIVKRLGQKTFDEVIHRDNLVILDD